MMDTLRVLNLVLVRAGPTVWDARGLLAGAADVPLAPEALHQAKAAFASLNGTASRVAAVVCGPEEACVKTADLFAAYCGVQEIIDPAMREVSLGIWEGVPEVDLGFRFRAMHKQWVADPARVRIPGGEPLADAMARALAAICTHIPRRSALVSRALAFGGLAGDMPAPGESPLMGVVVRPWLFGTLAAAGTGATPSAAGAGGEAGDVAGGEAGVHGPRMASTGAVPGGSAVRWWAVGAERLLRVRIDLDHFGDAEAEHHATAARVGSGA
jgi:broad specificity phosphatase PhoE